MSILISDEYLEKQKQMHKDKKEYGTSAKKLSNFVIQIAQDMGTKDILDYGCGKGTLQQNLPFKISQYDPAIEVHSSLPKPADLVVCVDVLEHIEPDYLDNVLEHLCSLTKQACFFVIDGNQSKKTLPDGTNAHLIVESGKWWFNKICNYFTIKSYSQNIGKPANDVVKKYIIFCEKLGE